MDTSVLLTACRSATGASRAIFLWATLNDWELIATPYVIEETERNLKAFPGAAMADWQQLKPQIRLCEDVVSLHLATIFPKTKDRPILFGALAWADVLLTLDHQDFGVLLGKQFYGLPIFRPGPFLEHERAEDRLLLPP